MPAHSSGATAARSRFFGNTQDEVFVHDDGLGVSAEGGTAEVLVGAAVGADHGGRELLEAFLAMWAGEIRIDHTADAGEVAGFEFGDLRADLGHATDDLVAGHGGVLGEMPLVAGEMEVGVAHAAEEDFELHIAVGRLATRDGGGGERRRGSGGGIGFDGAGDGFGHERECCESRLKEGARIAGGASSGVILGVGDVLEPVDGPAVEGFLNGEMGHRRGGCGAVPVLFARGEDDDIAGTDFLDGATFALGATAAGSHDESLTQRMRVPRRARAGLES